MIRLCWITINSFHIIVETIYEANSGHGIGGMDNTVKSCIGKLISRKKKLF